MIFFLIVPLWFVTICVGGLLIFFRATRWLSAYLMTSATLAVVFAFVASLLGLVGLAKLGDAIGAGNASGLLALGGYGIGLLAGGFSGAVIGVAIVAFFHYRARARLTARA